jgi:hypothetical protein
MPSVTKYVVHEAAVQGPATHAVVIGAGDYPHLSGGGAALYSQHGGMRQLSSPPISALRFADWLVRSFRHPTKPLASVALLASDASPVSFVHPTNRTTHAVERAEFPNVQECVRAWKGRADSSPDNLAIFYFCGHGIANGADVALLMSDFGADPDAALDAALDFRRFHLAMEKCKAREQCFFVDACRSGDSNIVDAAGYAGRPILTPSTRRDRSLRQRLAPAFFSTLAGEKAYAQTGELSRFTSCLLRAFRGAGADDPDGNWWVDTLQLARAIQLMMQRTKKQGFVEEQNSPVDYASMIQFHHLPAGPEVPVVVTCVPELHNEKATITCTPGAGPLVRDARTGDWEIDLPLGSYSFSAEFDGQPRVHADVSVRPAMRIVKLQV